MPRDCLAIIKSKSKVHYSQSKSIVSKVSMSSSTPGGSPDVAELKDMVRALLLDKKNQSQAPAIIKAVEESCVTCGGAHSYPPAIQASSSKPQGVSKDDFQNYIKANDAVMKNMQDQNQNMQNQLTNLTEKLTKFMNTNSASTSGSGSLPSDTFANPRGDMKAITTRSGVSYDGPQVHLRLSSLLGGGTRTRGDKGYGAPKHRKHPTSGGPNPK
ncbi:hypothetical protein Tco_0180153 [Tanacetum coccineum]